MHRPRTWDKAEQTGQFGLAPGGPCKGPRALFSPHSQNDQSEWSEEEGRMVAAKAHTRKASLPVCGCRAGMGVGSECEWEGRMGELESTFFIQLPYNLFQT